MASKSSASAGDRDATAPDLNASAGDRDATAPSRYSQRFASLEESKQNAFIPYTVLGWPDDNQCLKIVETMISSGVSALELGIPFSDPIADGPILQQAATEALAAGSTVDKSLVLLEKIRRLDQDIPIGLLVYFNTLMARGIEKFFSDVSRVGVDGVLIADLPVESIEEVLPSARKYNVSLIFLVSPLTTPDRLRKIIANASGFIYLISRLGVTGTTSSAESNKGVLRKLVKEIKSDSRLPVCAGFGISSPDSAKMMLECGCDGVITGSRVVELLMQAKASEKNRAGDPRTELEPFFSQMLAACKRSLSAVD